MIAHPLIPTITDQEIIIDLRSQLTLNDWDFFHRVVFDLPRLFYNQNLENKCVSVLVPATLEGLTPLDAQSSFIEGIRTFLSIARVHYLSESNNKWEFQVFPDSLDETAKTPLVFDKSTHHFSCGIDQKKDQQGKPVIIEIPLTDTIFTKGRVCISGGAGFIGSFLVQKLLQEGYQVIIVDNLLCSSLENIQEVRSNPNLFFVCHDVSQLFSLSISVDIVIHLASVPSPDDYYKMPIETLCAGLEGTKNMLELAVQNKARFLFSSTSEVYGDPEISPQPETYSGRVNFLGPRSQYDQSKRGAETLIKLYFDTYNLDVRIARIFNTYGPRMRLHDGRAVTNFIAAALEDKPLVIYGSGNQTRSFGYVEDTVQGLYDLMMIDFEPQASLFDRVFNIGTPGEVTIAELAEKIGQLGLKYLHKEPSITKIPSRDKTDPHMRCPDIRKAHAKFGFNPTISLEQGLEKTFRYFFQQYQQQQSRLDR
jgi:nucleoside-diphosphate-sugar epimerase